MKNYYHLSKKELSYFSFIQEPCFLSNGSRVTKPVVLCYLDDRVICVWSLSCFRSNVRQFPFILEGHRFELRAMY